MSITDLNNKEQINSTIFENYELLSDSGLLGYIETLNRTIVNKNELLNEAVEIFNKKNVSELVNYITSRFLNKFVPETLTFIIQDEVNADKSVIISFENMKPAKNNIVINDLGVYKDFFSLSPSSITYEAFEVMMDMDEHTEIFRVLNPELLVPMMGLEGVYGFIIFGKKVAFKPFEKDEISFIDEIMKFASISLQNIIHYKRAITDLKTRLFNHDFFMQSFNREIARLKRYDGEFGILIMDIDHFKRVNDDYGHIAGDRIIQLVAKTITHIVRTDDIPARFGGEEFIVLLTNCKKDFLMDVAERIRRKIERYKIAYNGREIKITLSIGAIHINKFNIGKADEILEKVDKALYYCKEHGRNQCKLYEGDIDE